jgi:hypothetical protein
VIEEEEGDFTHRQTSWPTATMVSTRVRRPIRSAASSATCGVRDPRASWHTTSASRKRTAAQPGKGAPRPRPRKSAFHR